LDDYFRLRTFTRLSFPRIIRAAYFQIISFKVEAEQNMNILHPRALIVPLAFAWAIPAGAADYLGAADCRIAALAPAPSGALAWNGACKDGYAEGKGTLQWTVGKQAHTIEEHWYAVKSAAKPN
jgi:hypothetical protein